jgi:dihydromonapterin reductase/dihydrofolate reductase
MTVTHHPVFITGAGRRIGCALARHFLQAGFPVLAHVHRESAESRELAALGAEILLADFAVRHQVQALTDHIVGFHSRLRAVIHNASAFDKSLTDPIKALEQFDRYYQIHMASPWLINTRLLPLLAAGEQPGDIVHITDIYADNPNPDFDLYCASKAGVQNLALSFAKKAAPRVKVNVIQPGPILFKEWHSEAMREKVLGETLLGFEAGPEPMLKAVSAVLDNPYQTGALIAVDGGRRLT